MTTENNKKVDDLKIEELQAALFEMRDGLTTLSLALKDHLFELQLSERTLDATAIEDLVRSHIKTKK